MRRIAVISVHGCPYIQAGEKDAGGMNIYVLETARKLAEMGHDVDVFTRHHDVLDPMVVHLGPRVRVIHIAAGPPSTDKNDVYPLLAEFEQKIQEFSKAEAGSYDVVSSHYWLSGLVGMELARAWGVPHVTSFHTLAEIKRRARPGESDVPERAGAERTIARAADRIVVWTPHEREALANYYGADRSRIEVIPPGVDGERFRPMSRSEARTRLGFGDERIILYVGRIERLKGLDILLHAVAQVDHHEDVRLNIVGGSANSPEMERLKDLARTLGLHDQALFFGSVTQDELPYHYASADICVLPSYYESFGLAALEAAACGRPVVASRVGGLPTVVLDGRTGFLIPWRCPGPFVERLELLLTNDVLRREMGSAAREHAATLTWAAAARGLSALFDRVIAERCGAGTAAD